MTNSNSLAGKPLRYFIGADHAVAVPGAVVEAPYGAAPPPGGIWYCNLYDQTKTGSYGPYLPDTETSKKYGEKVVDPNGPRWNAFIADQLALVPANDVVEWDNCDGYALATVLAVYDFTQRRAINVVAKNPSGSNQVLPPCVVGVVQEHDDSVTAASLHALRLAAGKPDLPLRFVTFAGEPGGEQWARQVAADAMRLRLVEVGVTFDHAKDEYGGDVEDFLLPTNKPSVPVMSRWPRDNQADLIAFYGMPGTSAVESQLVDVVPPFRMTYEGKPISAIKFHRKAAPALLAALTEIWEHYGKDQATLDRLGVSRYDGAYNPRFIRGSSTKWSNHAYGAAIDINAQDNGFNTGHGTMPQPVVDAFKRQGARWGGDYHGRTDPMHFEFCDNGESDALPGDPHPLIMLGSTGAPVLELQGRLGIAQSGTFDAATDAAVRAYQLARGLDVDGEVGPDTWGALMRNTPAVAASAGALPADVVAKIITLARNSLARTGWSNGTMPVGCINGLAVSYAMAYRDLKAGTSATLAMARPLGGASDALVLYGDKVNDPVSLLRADFELLFGSAMRESSGNYSEGRDTTANNVTADTAEAGLFQQSWNSHVFSSELPKLLAQWRTSSDDGLLSIFREGVNDKQTQDFGSGDGAVFQRLCKTKPRFAVWCAAVGQRVVDSHWGPISRHEAQMRPEVAVLLQQVEAIMDAMQPEKPDKPIDGEPLHPDQPDPFTPPPPGNFLGNPLLLAGLAALLSGLTGQQNMTTPGQGFDLSKLFGDLPKFFAILQDPILQRLLADQPVRLSELKTLPPEFLSLITGAKAPQILLPSPQPDPAAQPQPDSTKPAGSVPVPAANAIQPWVVNLATGILSMVLPGAAWLGGVLPDAAALITGTAGVSASALNIPGLISKFFSGFKVSRA